MTITDGTTTLQYIILFEVVAVMCTINGKYYDTYNYSLQETFDDITYRLANGWKEVE